MGLIFRGSIVLSVWLESIRTRTPRGLSPPGKHFANGNPDYSSFHHFPETVKVVLYEESHFNLKNNDGCTRYQYTNERCLPDGIIERPSGRTPGVVAGVGYRTMEDFSYYELRII
ncbi:hypothetical protein TNCV_853471 [Trichonephila clavipes]|nr:hypothetical protein TNCV_853471 [Trichonephila clavipes]